MTKLLYNPTTDAISRYPRVDDEPVVGLDPSLVVLTEILPERPSHDPATHYLEQTREIDLDAGTLTRGWLIRERPPVEPMPPEPRWIEFGLALGQDASMIEFVRAADAANPILERMISGGLLQAAEGNPRTFMAAWPVALAAGLVTPELAAHVQTLAASYDLPEAFVAGLNPQA